MQVLETEKASTQANSRNVGLDGRFGLVVSVYKALVGFRGLTGLKMGFLQFVGGLVEL